MDHVGNVRNFDYVCGAKCPCIGLIEKAKLDPILKPNLRAPPPPALLAVENKSKKGNETVENKPDTEAPKPVKSLQLLTLLHNLRADFLVRRASG